MKEKQVTVFVAEDGTEFTDREKCAAYERDSANIARMLKPLGARPTSVYFANGEGYIQHDRDTVTAVHRDLMRHFADTGYGFGFLGRYLSDNDSPYYVVWSRLSCIDELGREWGQPYYALNPHKGKQVPFEM